MIPMADLPIHTIPAGTLKDFVAAMFDKLGCDAAESERIARYLVNANLTGHDSHGVIRTPRYVEDVRSGRTIPGLSVTVVSESATHAVLEGNNGFGQTIAPQAVDIGIAKAKKAGMAVVTLRHAAHIGRIGEWGEQAARAGLVAIHFVNVENSLLVAPFGGKQRRFATNPVCIAIPPMDGRPMLLLDMATSVVAEGKVMVARQRRQAGAGGRADRHGRQAFVRPVHAVWPEGRGQAVQRPQRQRRDPGVRRAQGIGPGLHVRNPGRPAHTAAAPPGRRRSPTGCATACCRSTSTRRISAPPTSCRRRWNTPTT